MFFASTTVCCAGRPVTRYQTARKPPPPTRVPTAFQGSTCVRGGLQGVKARYQIRANALLHPCIFHLSAMASPNASLPKKPTRVAAPSPRASLGRRMVCGRTEQRRPQVSKRYETKVRMWVWGSFLIAAAALKTPTKNGCNAQGVNLTFFLIYRYIPLSIHAYFNSLPWRRRQRRRT